MRMDKGKPFMHVGADSGDVPTFSESFLYKALGKGDGRFVLGVAEEYEHVIDALGPAAVRAILQVKPKLVQRLRTGQKVTEWLEDARTDADLRREEDLPSEVTLDAEAAHAVWQGLHDEYRRFYNPEESMDKDSLRAYHKLTDGLGRWERGEREKEQARLPEKLEKQRAKRAEIAAKREEAERA